MTFARPGVPSPINANFTRAVIHIPAVPYTLSLGNKIGYIPLQLFNENAAENVAAAVKQFQAAGRARHHPRHARRSGRHSHAERARSRTCSSSRAQQIAAVKGREGPPEVDVANAAPIAPTIPLIVMTDERTASASEIVAGALQDHDRALVVGQTSFGKGLVQGVYPLDGGYALKLTTGKWFTPSGRTIQRPRKFVNGQFVETPPDTNETNATKKTRPAYKSDGGRVVYGGGGITPDVIVQDDTLTTAEQQFTKAIAPKGQDFITVLTDYSMELAKTVDAGLHGAAGVGERVLHAPPGQGRDQSIASCTTARTATSLACSSSASRTTSSAIRRPSVATCRTTRRSARRSSCSRRARRSATCSPWPARR